jgi:hypothetical protein
LQLGARGRVGPWRLLGLDLDGTLNLDGLPEPWLDALGLTRFVPLEGTLGVAGRLGGSTRRPEFEGSVELGGGRFGAVRDAALTGELSAGPKGLEFRQVRGTSNVLEVEELSGSLGWDDGVKLSARGRASGYRLRPSMEVLFPGQFFPVGLNADGEFQVQGPLVPELALGVRGEFNVRDLDVTTDAEGERRTRFSLPQARLRARCTVGRHEISFGPSRVETPSLDLDVSGGRIAYREGLWFATAGQIRSLALARPLVPEWVDARGRAEGRFGGPYRALEFAYDVDLDSVSLSTHVSYVEPLLAFFRRREKRL